MTSRADRHAPSARIDFFISYSPADERWATWIAWQLELAGYRTMLQAWDFVPGTNFIDFMDRGLSQSAAVIAVLSSNYVRSRYGRMEWQTALRSSPDLPDRRLITVRIEDFPIDGLLSTITFLDLVPEKDPHRARDLLLQRVAAALNGRAKPDDQPTFPADETSPESEARHLRVAVTRRHSRLRSPTPVSYPPAKNAIRVRSRARSIIHLSALHANTARSGMRHRADSLLDGIMTTLDRSGRFGEDGPDAMIVSGGLTASGHIREFDEVHSLLVRLRAALDLEANRIAIVPGETEVNKAASLAYFADCEADDREPQPPYWRKWRHYARFFAEFYDSVEGIGFVEERPWTLFDMSDLGVVIAGMNATVAMSHRDADAYFKVGPQQIEWFANRLHSYRPTDWTRIAVLGCPPLRTDTQTTLVDQGAIDDELADQIDLVVTSAPGPTGVSMIDLPPLSQDDPRISVTRLDVDL